MPKGPTKTKWMTKEWLSRRDSFVAGLEPETLYSVKDVSDRLGFPDSTLTDHIYRHSPLELRTDSGKTIPGRELALVLLKFHPAWTSGPSRSIPKPSKLVSKPSGEPASEPPEVRETFEFMAAVLDRFPAETARKIAFDLAKRFSRAGQEDG